MPKLYIIVNEDRFFLSHRTQIALSAQKIGYDVTVVCKDTGSKQIIIDFGFKWLALPVNPTGSNMIEETRTFHFLYKLYKQESPDIVHHVGLKSILWGGLAAKLVKTPCVVNSICGLGTLFSGERLSIQTWLVMQVIRFSCHRTNIVSIFQNHEDMQLFISNNIVRKENCVLIKGSGINLKEWEYYPEQNANRLRIIFTARMLREKGPLILIDAAELLRSEMENHVEFMLCGSLSDNPKALSKEELESRCDGIYIRWLGNRNDIRELMRSSHIMAFPSYYREGLPLSLIEAAACGRPIVTTDSIGCRDVVDNGINGFLVPIQDSKTLAQKLRLLINDKSLRIRMGKEGRAKAEREFSIDNVVKNHLQIYEKALRSAMGN